MGEGAYCQTWTRFCVSSLWLSAPIFFGSRMARGRIIGRPRLRTVFPGLSLRNFEIHRVPKVGLLQGLRWRCSSLGLRM